MTPLGPKFVQQMTLVAITSPQRVAARFKQSQTFALLIGQNMRSERGVSSPFQGGKRGVEVRGVPPSVVIVFNLIM